MSTTDSERDDDKIMYHQSCTKRVEGEAVVKAMTRVYVDNAVLYQLIAGV